MANTLKFKRGLVSTIPTAALGEPLFTTDTFDLYIGNGTGNTRFQKYIASGATTQILRGDGSLYTFPLAISSPTNGQVLKYNGTSWVNDSDAGITGSLTTNYLPKATGATTLGNSRIFDNGTNVGIGTASADVELAVYSASVSRIHVQNSTSGVTATDGFQFAISGTNGFLWNWENGDIRFATNNTERMRLTANGRLLLGTTTEGTFLLDVNGTARVSGQVTGNSFVPTTSTIPTNGMYLPTTNAISFSTNTTERIRIDANGNIGIGTSTPTAVTLYTGVTTNGTNGSWYVLSQGGTNKSVFETGGSMSQLKTLVSEPLVLGTNNVERMRIDANGSVGIGTTSPTERLQVNGALRITGAITNNTTGGILAYQGSGNTLLGAWGIDASTRGLITFYLANSTGTTGSEFMRLNNTGNLLIRSTTDTGEALQVTGTMKVTGASTFGGVMQIGSGVIYSGIPAFAQFIVGSRTTTDAGIVIQSTSTSISRLLLLNASDNGSIVRQDHSTGDFEIFNNGSKRLTIASTGAATFSSSVTAGTRFIVNSTTNAGVSDISLGSYLSGAWLNTPTSTIGYLAVGGTGSIRWEANRQIFYIAGTEGMRFDGNLGIGTTSPSYKLDVTGQARVSDAIAIGTTPDTNKPFKILKSINSTVGINFENTSTGSSAFSAIQMGTDVTGGTKFTNLVYASSGVTASGVYNPDGTSLINNGSGGLNFLGNPIRMYTGGSNGVLRWDMTNDGFITQYNGTNPSTSATDGYRQYSADITAGNAAPHFRTENGAVIKLYQETTAVGNAIISLGGGNAVLDDTTFDGYTLRQIVRALRNQGILQ